MALSDIKQHPTLTSVELVRDVNAILSLILTNIPVMSFIPFGSPPAKQHTHEWFDDNITQTTSTLTADITAHLASATGLTITVADSSKFLVNDQVFIDTLEPAYLVTAIPGGGVTLTVTEIRAVALGADAGDTKTIKFNRSVKEKTAYGDVTAKGARTGTQVINYTQIFRKDVEVSESLQAETEMGMTYGLRDGNAFANAIQGQLWDIAWELYQAVTLGVALKRTTTSIEGKMNGLRQYIDVTGGNRVTASGALTLDNLNDCTALIYDDTSNLANLVMVAPTVQNRVLATFDSTRIRYNDPAPTRGVGFNVATFIPDIGGSGGIPIIIDPNMPKQEIWFLDTSRIALIPLGNRLFGIRREKVQGTTADQAYIVGELTLELRNGAQSHGIIKGLAV